VKKNFRYTPASRFRKKWKTALVMFFITLIPVIAKLFSRPDLSSLLLIFAGLYCLGALILAMRLMMTWNKVYSFSVNGEGVTYSIDGVLVSSIRWQDIRKVKDADPYYVKLFSASTHPISIDSMMSVYALTRRYIAEKISADKIKYVRFWARPLGGSK